MEILTFKHKLLKKPIIEGQKSFLKDTTMVPDFL